jgi:hypothetical protein
MVRLVLLTCATFSLSSFAHFTTYVDLDNKQLPAIETWKELPMAGNHRDRQPTQPPSEWTNLTFMIPFAATGVQLTAVDSNGTLTSGGAARVNRFSIDQIRGRLKTSIIWWGTSWTLFVGFLTNQTKG